MRIGDLTTADDGRLLIGVNGAGLKQVAGDKLESYPIRGASNPNALLTDRDVDSNKLLRDRDGGLWIGTMSAGSSMYTRAGQTYLQSQMASQEISLAVSSRIVKATSGSPPPEGWTAFESFPSLRSLRNKVCPAMLLMQSSQPQMGAFG